MTDVLPNALATWEQYEADPGDTFLRYNLYRLNPHTGAYDTVATINQVDTLQWWDFLAWPGENTYRLTVTVESSGAVIESEPAEVTGVTFAWLGLWLHEIVQPEEQVRLLASTLDSSLRQGQTWRLAAGRRRETMFTGPMLSRGLSLQLIPADLRDPEGLAALERHALLLDADPLRLELQFLALGLLLRPLGLNNRDLLLGRTPRVDQLAFLQKPPKAVKADPAFLPRIPHFLEQL